MRKKVVAGNWKMNPVIMHDAATLINDLAKAVKNQPVKADLFMVAPPSVYLGLALKRGEGSGIAVAAQNCHEKENGAYTGELSAGMIKSIGASHVIIGHSERRAYFGETNAQLAEKVSAALHHDLVPIYCCGETLEERKNGTYKSVIATQLEEGLAPITDQTLERVIIAYEPVWAIGTGETASPEQAQEVHAFIRAELTQRYGATVANGCSILYGGSVKPANASAIFSKPDVDGGLVGGASLKADDFIAIANAF